MPHHVVVLKYLAYTDARFRSIDKREDLREMTFSILSNGPGEFEGDGPIFYVQAWNPEDELLFVLPASGLKITPDRPGPLIFHGGRAAHASIPVISGIRYLLIGFSIV